MLPVDGPVVAPPEVRPHAWALALPPETRPLVLAPASGRGWFGGLELVTWSPHWVRSGSSMSEAAAGLADCASSAEPSVCAVVLPYCGPILAARYTGGVVRTAEGWRTWGSLPPKDVPPVRADGEPPSPPAAPLVVRPCSDMTAREFRAGVRSVIEAIRAGDVYVLNLTRRITGQPAVPPPVAFASLLDRSGAEMGAYWAAPGLTLASASPERFARVSGDLVEVCPIKGTRPRAAGESDAEMIRSLRASEKERAEHVMIVDLVRNDLGRVCRPGSVTVDPLFEIVTTPYCHQMVSSVHGRLRAGESLATVLESVFPCGSVTGAPKIAAMRTIDTLEPSCRAAYTGSLVVAIPGEIDSSILIRTAEYSASGMRWGTGGGITVDSDAAEEWLETELKASPLLGDGLPDVGLRETCRVVNRTVPLLARHLARLAAGGCGPTLLASVRDSVGTALESHHAQHFRMALTVHPSGAIDVELSDTPSSLEVPGGPAVSPVVSTVPVLPRGAAKPMDRRQWDAAQQEAIRLGAHQAVLVDADRRVLDGATASVWIRVGDRLLTPPAPPAVDGVGRGVVFDVAHECGYRADERAFSLDELMAADEVFLSNALAGVVPVRGRSGPAATALDRVFRAISIEHAASPGSHQP